MLSAAKHLARGAPRCFAALSMTAQAADRPTAHAEACPAAWTAVLEESIEHASLHMSKIFTILTSTQNSVSAEGRSPLPGFAGLRPQVSPKKLLFSSFAAAGGEF